VALPLDTVLDGRYHIGKVLGKPGGFGVTYLAFDDRLQQQVAVKEFMPRDVAARDTDGESVVLYSGDEEETFQYGLDRFLREARTLARFDHANIVSVRDFFETNGTGYLAMDYYEGKTLKQYLSEQTEGRMDPENATEVMLRVLDGLREIHAEDYLHRDIKPGNIYLTKEGRPILIDFGSARLALGERSRSLSVVMTEGYAPYEQYSREGNQGPHTDVYGCGATLYRMVTGKKPPPATDRVLEDKLETPNTLNPAVPEALSEVIMGALAMGDEERIPTAEAFQERLQASLKKKASPAPGQDGSGSGKEEESGSVEEAARVSEGTGRGDPDRAAAEGEDPNSDQKAGWSYVVIGLLVAAALALGGVAAALYPSGGTSLGEGEGSQTADQNVSVEQSTSEEQSTTSVSRSEANQLLKEARGHLKAGRLTRPKESNALVSTREVLKRDSSNEDAQRLLGKITDRLETKGDSAREKGALSAAIDFYERSLEVETRPEVKEKLENVRRLADRREEAERLLTQVQSTLRQESPTAQELGQAAEQARRASELKAGGEEGLVNRIADRAAELGAKLEAELQYAKATQYYEQSQRLREDPDVKKKLSEIRAIREGRRPIRTLRGHGDYVQSVAFSPDGRLLATASRDETVKLWATETGEEVQTLHGHGGFVQSVAFSPDGRLLATGSLDGTARLWSVENGEEIRTLRGHENSVRSVAFSPDGELLATGSSDETAKLWSVETGEEVRTLRGHDSSVSSVAFSPDGRLLATGSFDNTAMLWSVETGEKVRTLPEQSTVASVTFLPKSQLVVTGNSDGTAKLWSVSNGRKVRALRGHESDVHSAEFSQNGDLVATGSADGMAKLWKVETGKEVRTLGGHSAGVFSVAFSPDGRLVATGSADETAKLWYVPQGL
jgi:WD40 repeat protein